MDASAVGVEGDEVSHNISGSDSDDKDSASNRKKRDGESSNGIVDNDNLMVSRKRMKAAAEEFLCPISHELFVDPVIAEDGEFYECENIETLIYVQGDNLRSPMTNLPMGKSLKSATRLRNAVQKLVECNAFTGELVQNYCQRVSRRKLVVETKKKAEEGDTRAMNSLRIWYSEGSNGLPQNDKLADEWEIRICKSRAERGSSTAMVLLGYKYRYGSPGCQKDKKEAFKWFMKAACLRMIS